MSLILPLTDILKPQNMSRRGFLRFLGITTTIATVPSLIIPKPNLYKLWIADGRTGKCYEFERYAYPGETITITYDKYEYGDVSATWQI